MNRLDLPVGWIVRTAYSLQPCAFSLWLRAAANFKHGGVQ
jgi:hypothetical protein